MGASGWAVTGGGHTRIDVAAGCRQAFFSKSLGRLWGRIGVVTLWRAACRAGRA